MTATLQLAGIRDPIALVKAFIDRGQIRVALSSSADPASLEANRRWRERNRAKGLSGRGEPFKTPNSERLAKQRYRDKLKAMGRTVDGTIRIRTYLKRNGLSKNRQAYMEVWRAERAARGK